ncbi:MAG: F0F1 ATP synthase subunit delta, partial [Janthinobacterium lividum]
MAELATIARPYAEALFRVAKAGNLPAWSELVSEMAHVASNPEVQGLAHNPKLSDQLVGETFSSLLKSPLNAEAKNFIAMLVENGRLSLLADIAVQFQALKNAQEGAADAEIFSAFDLSARQVQQVVAVLEKKFGRKINPTVTVD